MEAHIIQNSIELLLLESFNVLQINVNQQYLYFIVHKWQPSFFASSETIDYNTIEGINITEFILKNASMYRSHTEFISHFREFIKNKPVLCCQFTKSSEWFYWKSI